MGKNIRGKTCCKVKGCPWEIYCAWNKATKSFQLKTFVKEHNCGSIFKNNQANRKWVAKNLSEKLKIHPTLTHHETHEYMKIEFGVTIDERKMCRALQKAKKHG